MIRLELLDDGAERAWDEQVASLEGGTIFHTWAWLRVIEKLKGAHKLPVGIFDGADLIGVWPLFRVRRGPFTLLASPLGGTGYGGPLVSETHRKTVLERLDGLSKRWGADYVEFRALQELAPKTLAATKYKIQKLQTYVLSLSRPPEALWSNLQGRCRNAVRKARKNNVEIVEATDTSYLDDYYAMAQDTFAKSNRRPPLSIQDHQMIWDVLRPYDRIKVLLARHEGQWVAGVSLLLFDDKAYGWDSVSLRSHYHLSANNLLHWTLIEWGAQEGLTQYDMTGANIPSIARFKASFGCELKTYTYAYKEVTWQAWVGRRLYLWLLPRLQRVRFRLRPA